MTRFVLHAATGLALGLVALACAPDPIDWQDPQPLPAALMSAGDVELNSEGKLQARTPPSIAMPMFIGLCAGSLRVARDTTGDWYGVWWSIRPDSTADIVVSRSSDGVTWMPSVRVDSTDAGRFGCRRPAPSIAADGGNVHVAYSMTAREGPGIFASHSMDRGMMFHAPVAVVYGERPALTAIAARGDLVGIAYEDPNSNPTRIGLAFSKTMAHTFDWRGLVSPATSGAVAHSPGVAVTDGLVAVLWAQGDSANVAAPRLVRMGHIR